MQNSNKEKNDHDKKFKDFLEYISSGLLSSEEDYTQAISQARDIYCDGYRHSYSLITAFILRGDDQQKQKIILTNLSENIGLIIELLKPEKDSYLLEKLEKLNDHINLESSRLEYYKDNIFKLEDSTLKIRNNQQETINELEEKTQKIETNLKNQQTQYITILGIFASIVLAFVSGLTFSTSVFTNIHHGSIYRLIFVMVFIACFMTNILYYLFRFIKNLNTEKPESIFKDKTIISFNALMLIILMCDGAIYLHNH